MGVNVPYSYCVSYNSPFMSVNICFMYIGVPMLSTYIFIIVISSLIDPLIIK